jgi:hypothetical protein
MVGVTGGAGSSVDGCGWAVTGDAGGKVAVSDGWAGGEVITGAVSVTRLMTWQPSKTNAHNRTRQILFIMTHHPDHRRRMADETCIYPTGLIVHPDHKNHYNEGSLRIAVNHSHTCRMLCDINVAQHPATCYGKSQRAIFIVRAYVLQLC